MGTLVMELDLIEKEVFHFQVVDMVRWWIWHIHKVTHIEAYLPTLGNIFRNIQDSTITGSNNVKQHLLFKSRTVNH